MSENKIYPVKQEIAASSHNNAENYLRMYQYSLDKPEEFWAEQAKKILEWSKPWDTVMNCDFQTGYIRWFEGGTLNVSVNCIDRHLELRGDQVAIIWEGDNPSQDKKITYRQLHKEVCKFANVLKSQGVKKGDCVCIYLPMISEAATVMLACTRIGAVHSVVFGGFSAEALKDRIVDSDCHYVVCADEGYRGGKTLAIKANVDSAAEFCPKLKKVIVIRNTGNLVGWDDSRDIWYDQVMLQASDLCPAVEMAAEDPLFILYTSGSTGKPKGILHTTGGYLLYAAITFKYVLDCY